MNDCIRVSFVLNTRSTGFRRCLLVSGTRLVDICSSPALISSTFPRHQHSSRRRSLVAGTSLTDVFSFQHSPCLRLLVTALVPSTFARLRYSSHRRLPVPALVLSTSAHSGTRLVDVCSSPVLVSSTSARSSTRPVDVCSFRHSSRQRLLVSGTRLVDVCSTLSRHSSRRRLLVLPVFIAQTLPVPIFRPSFCSRSAPIPVPSSRSLVRVVPWYHPFPRRPLVEALACFSSERPFVEALARLRLLHLRHPLIKAPACSPSRPVSACHSGRLSYRTPFSRYPFATLLLGGPALPGPPLQLLRNSQPQLTRHNSLMHHWNWVSSRRS